MQAHAVFNFLYTFALVAATVATHATGIMALGWCLIRYEIRASRHFKFLHNLGFFIAVIGVLIMLHLIEVKWWSSALHIVRAFSRSVDGVLLFADDLCDPGIR